MAGNGKMIITEDMFKTMPPHEQAWTIYNTVISHDNRICDLEKRKLIDRLYSFGGGILGGIVGFWLNLLGGGGGQGGHP